MLFQVRQRRDPHSRQSWQSSGRPPQPYRHLKTKNSVTRFPLAAAPAFARRTLLTVPALVTRAYDLGIVSVYYSLRGARALVVAILAALVEHGVPPDTGTAALVLAFEDLIRMRDEILDDIGATAWALTLLVSISSSQNNSARSMKPRSKSASDRNAARERYKSDQRPSGSWSTNSPPAHIASRSQMHNHSSEGMSLRCSSLINHTFTFHHTERSSKLTKPSPSASRTENQ
mmetsp:Transcript_11531/g.24882  ORF Transcript_11531/g.24882 Transcript_11531/m.24882 type:complete len:231 (+) Transcript_11531:1557-2249(+)